MEVGLLEMVEAVEVEAVDNVLHQEEVGRDLPQAEVDSDPHPVAVDKGPLQENKVCCLCLCNIYY